MCPKLLTVDEAVSKLRISKSSLYKQAEAGKIPVVRLLPGKLLFSEETLEALIRQAETGGANRQAGCGTEAAAG